jgi:hypothetical protein
MYSVDVPASFFLTCDYVPPQMNKERENVQRKKFLWPEKISSDILFANKVLFIFSSYWH